MASAAGAMVAQMARCQATLGGAAPLLRLRRPARTLFTRRAFRRKQTSAATAQLTPGGDAGGQRCDGRWAGEATTSRISAGCRSGVAPPSAAASAPWCSCSSPCTSASIQASSCSQPTRAARRRGLACSSSARPATISSKTSSRSSWPTPRTPGASSSSGWAVNTSGRTSCCSAARCSRPAASPRRRSGRSTVRVTASSISICRSPAAPVDGPCRTGVVHPRQLRPARALVQARDRHG